MGACLAGGLCAGTVPDLTSEQDLGPEAGFEDYKSSEACLEVGNHGV